jgi:3-hydroxyisobutyrate dehydrogenase
MSRPPVGFIGIGIMGRPMAGHILEAGYPLTIFNRTRSKTADLASRGAAVAASPAEVAGRSEIVVTMVTDTPDLEQVVAGPGGVLEQVRPGSIVVDMSTVSPDLERRLDARLRAAGGSLVDAPVSGGDVGARDATLAIMAGGDRGAVDRVRPLLGTLGKTITYCGPTGSGQIAKLSNQILVAVTLLGVSEAILFARRNGLDPATMIEAVSGGAAGSWQLANLGPKILAGDFAPGFMVDLIQKDLRLVLEAGAAAGVPLSATALVHQLLRSVQAHGEGRLGTQVLARAVARLAGEESSGRESPGGE